MQTHQLQDQVQHRAQRMVHKTPVVERVIAFFGGSPAEAARRIGVSRQVVNNWRVRGRIPRAYIKRVHALTKIPLTDLIADEG